MRALIGILIGVVALGGLAVAMQEPKTPATNPQPAQTRAEKSRQMDATVERERKEREQRWATTPKGPRDAFEERAWMVADCVRTRGHGKFRPTTDETGLAINCGTWVDLYLSGKLPTRPDGSK